MESQKKDIIVDVETNGDFCVHDIKAKVDTFTPKGQCLFRLKNKSNGKLIRVRADSDGRPYKIFKKSGDNVTPGEVVIEYKIEQCQHTTVMKDMCAECGVDLQQENSKFSKSSASVAIVHNIPELKVSSSLAQNLGQEDEKRLLKDRKLVLLVDLDQTLIHTTNKTIVKSAKKCDDSIIDFQLTPTSVWYHCKIRPGTSEFLKKISQHFELHIVTFGSRPYAHKIAGFLDPDGKYFSHRILSRDECFDSRSKTANLASLFPCGDQMVCIIDDRQDVWNSAPNLIQVKPYIFFKNTGDINAPPGTSENQQMTKNNEVVLDENDSDDYLVYLEHILIKIHKTFYKAYDSMTIPKSVDLKNVIPSLKRKVLRGINIVFTGLIPNHEPLKLSHAFKIATSLGANVQDTIVKDTTHLVANRRGTVKYTKARKNPKIEIVSPEWLWSCAERWDHVSEEPFRLTKVKENFKEVNIETSFDDSIEQDDGKSEEFWDEEDFETIEKEIEKMLDDNSRRRLCP